MNPTSWCLAILLALLPTGMTTTSSPPDYCAEESGSWHCFSTYELQGLDIASGNQACDPSSDPLCPSDGSIDMTSILYDGCLSPNWGDGFRDYPYCGGLSDEAIYIHDDFWGPATGANPVGALYCEDRDGDGACGEFLEGERYELFCGHVTLYDVDAVNSYTLGYFVDGPFFQFFDCPASGAFLGATTGALSIWVTPA
jgi:hypothetical protein